MQQFRYHVFLTFYVLGLTGEPYFFPYTILLQVYGWGRGEHGRLGFGDNDKSSKMVPQKVHLLAGEDIVQVPIYYIPCNFSDSFA